MGLPARVVKGMAVEKSASKTVAARTILATLCGVGPISLPFLTTLNMN
jgi:hypothetical protein